MKASEVLFRMKNENKKQEEELTNKIIEGNETLKNIQKMKNITRFHSKLSKSTTKL